MESHFELIARKGSKLKNQKTHITVRDCKPEDLILEFDSFKAFCSPTKSSLEANANSIRGETKLEPAEGNQKHEFLGGRLASVVDIDTEILANIRRENQARREVEAGEVHWRKGG